MNNLIELLEIETGKLMDPLKVRAALIGIVLAIVSTSGSAMQIWGRCDADCMLAPTIASTYPEGDHIIYGETTVYAFTNRLEMQGNNCHVNAAPPSDGSSKQAPVLQRVGCTQVMVTVPRIPDAWETFGVKDLQLYHVIAKGITRIEVDASHVGTGPVGNSPAGYGPNAYDYKNNAIFRGNVDNFARQAISDEIEDIVATMDAQRAGLVERVKGMVRDIYTKDIKNIVVTVVFPDKSYVILEFKIEADFVPVPLAIKDSENRDILTKETADEFEGEMRFQIGGEISLQNWLANARREGITIITSGGGSGVLESVTCTWDGETLICHKN